MIGTTLSHYEIEAELGRGGMGIVYKALDTKLDRTVALKVLPAAALASQDDRARFYREAKAAAALNHPNIAQIYQIDEAAPEGSPTDDVRPYIAMEFIEGGTLEDQIKHGPLILDEAVRIATQVAEALKAAHAKQIVHRDIKSANIMLTKDGQAKVLDFGLAQTNHSTKLTRMGSTLGTIAYMSPEQARGEEVDGRTDLYSLGTVLYEMIAGKLPFGGEYEQAVVYSILNADPEPLTALRTGVPMELEAVVTKALRKDASHRYQTGADMVADLAALNLTSGSGARTTMASSSTPPSIPSPHPSGLSGTKVAGIAIIALLVGAFLSSAWFASGDDGTSFDIALSLPGLEAKIGREAATASDLVALSYDGKMVAYMGVAPEEGLFVRDLTTGESARRIASRAETPAFSPDGRFIAYASGGTLYRAGLQGDAPQKLVDQITDIVGLQWATDGYLYFAADYATGVSRIAADGGPVERITIPDHATGEIGHVYPDMLPDGRTLLYTAYSKDGYELRTLDVESKQLSKLGFGVSPHFIGPDIVIYAQGPRLLAARLDIKKGQLGPPVVLSEAIYHNLASFSTNFGVSQNGDVLFIDGASTWNVPLEIRGWDGASQIVAPEVPDINQYGLSSDGRYIVMAGQDAVADPDIWLYDLQTGDTRQVTKNPLYDAQPVLSSDGSTIWFSSERNGLSDIYSIDLVTGSVDQVFSDSIPKYISSLSKDGSFLIYQAAFDLYVLDLRNGGVPEKVVEGGVEEREGQFSPDGKWIVYSSEESGQPEVFVVDYPVTRPRQRITTGGGKFPKWSKDGRSIYYKHGTELFRVPVNATGGRSGDPVRIMENVFDEFVLLPDDTGILIRATPPHRSVRYIQDVVSRIERELDQQ